MRFYQQTITVMCDGRWNATYLRRHYRTAKTPSLYKGSRCSFGQTGQHIDIMRSVEIKQGLSKLHQALLFYVSLVGVLLNARLNEGFRVGDAVGATHQS